VSRRSSRGGRNKEKERERKGEEYGKIEMDKIKLGRGVKSQRNNRKENELLVEGRMEKEEREGQSM